MSRPDSPSPSPSPSPAPADGRFVSAQLLLDLVANTLDPGYADATARRGADPVVRHWYDRAAVALGCLLIGFIGVVAYVHANRGAPAAERVQQGLVSRVRDAQRSTQELATRLGELQKQLAAVRNRALAPADARALAGAQLAAGQVAVSGPGITVTLSEPPTAANTPAIGRGGTTPIASTNILTDRDVRSVVNELWHDGAEAIAVNGVRLTPTSAVRVAGQAVLVDLQPITSPYRIQAVGSIDALSTGFAQSSVASRYQTLVGVDGIGFRVDDNARLALAAGSPANLRFAHESSPGTAGAAPPARKRSGR